MKFHSKNKFKDIQALASMAKYKDVVVIGNGPSGITMSYFLAGNWPYYGPNACHPNPYLHARLEDNRHLSLVEQDLSLLSSGLEGRSCNPVSLLLDTLCHPDADLGSDEPSSLVWHHRPSRKLDHVVLGNGLPGGSWQRMDGGILTISLGSWMELPDLTFKEWDLSKPQSPQASPNCQNRVSVQRVAQYYRDYVDLKGLQPYFQNFACVQSVRPCGDADDPAHLWEVTGVDRRTGVAFCYITPHVVVAAGHYDAPRQLGAPGEDLPFVSHDLGQLEVLLRDNKSSVTKLAVVGSGLSAADAVIAARFHGIDVCHVFRKKVDDPELVFNQLPRSMYPEYHKVHQMMSSAERYPGYKAYANCQVLCIHSDGRMELDSGSEIRDVSHVLVLIGSHPNLDFLPQAGQELGMVAGLPIDCRANPIQIDPYTHETVAMKGIYALGPLVGDNFVRFLQGGALAVTAHIWHVLGSS
ncbi:oxidative stress-induced growth inhibitor 1-like isoform X2 [Haemaphysalis longicornis]